MKFHVSYFIFTLQGRMIDYCCCLCASLSLSLSSNASWAEETGGHASWAATHASAHTAHHHGVEAA
jgi:hypothetical protein